MIVEADMVFEGERVEFLHRGKLIRGVVSIQTEHTMYVKDENAHGDLRSFSHSRISWKGKGGMVNFLPID